MGTIHKINDEYYIEFYARGLLYQQKAGKDLGKAEELLRQTEEKIARGELQTIAREIDVDIFFAEFLKYVQTQYHPHTVRRLKSVIEHFTGFLQSQCPTVKKISQVTPRVAEDYKAYLIKPIRGTINEKAVNFTILLLREILEHGIKTGYINDNPTLHVRLLGIKSHRQLIFSTDQWEKFLEHAEEPFRSIFILMRQTGLRPHEVSELTWQQVDFNRNIIFVKSREMPLTSQALSILQDRFKQVIDHKARVLAGSSGKPMDAAELFGQLESVKLSAGLPSRIFLATLRHSFACDLLHKRISFLMVGKIFGVHDIAKLMIYASCIPTQRKDILP